MLWVPHSHGTVPTYDRSSIACAAGPPAACAPPRATCSTIAAFSIASRVALVPRKGAQQHSTFRGTAHFCSSGQNPVDQLWPRTRVPPEAVSERRNRTTSSQPRAVNAHTTTLFLSTDFTSKMELCRGGPAAVSAATAASIRLATSEIGASTV